MERNEHLQWAKDRALQILKTEDSMQAWGSFTSDMSKHEELKGHIALELGLTMLLSGMWNSGTRECEKFIEGFN